MSQEILSYAISSFCPTSADGLQRNITIEFGPSNERISLYTGDTAKNGKGNLKGALRELVPIMMNSAGAGNVRHFDTGTMFNMCDEYKATPISSIARKYWVVEATVSCKQCDGSQGATSTTIKLTKTDQYLRSERECLRTLKDFKEFEQHFKKQGLMRDERWSASSRSTLRGVQNPLAQLSPFDIKWLGKEERRKYSRAPH
jgi:hypothetical protein